MSPIVYTHANLNSISISNTDASKSMLDIIELVLCDGWQPIEVSGAVVSNNKLTITSPNAIPRSVTWYALFELNVRNVQIDGEWRCTGVNNNTATFTPVGRIVPDYSGSATGSITQVSAGWTKLYKSADFLVIRPAGETKRCFMFKQNLGNGMVSTLNDVYSTPAAMSSTGAAINGYCQCFPLHDWDDALSAIENFNSHVIPIRTNIIDGHTTTPYPVSHQIKPSINGVTGWYLVATGKYCYFGIDEQDAYNMAGIGITPNVYGQECIWISGGHYSTDGSDSRYNYKPRRYSMGIPEYTNPGNTMMIQDPTGQFMISRLRSIENYMHGNVPDRLTFIDSTTEDLMIRIYYSKRGADYGNVSVYNVPYLKVPGVCLYYGNINTVASYEKVQEDNYLVLRTYSANSGQSFVGIKV